LSYSIDKGVEAPLTKFENLLVSMGIPICRKDKEGENPDDSGKLLISTFHSSKGLERKHVIIFGFDDFMNGYISRGKRKNDVLAAAGMMTEPYYGK